MMALILSAAEGGIRKHVFDLLAESSFIKKNCSLLIYPKNQTDVIFDADDRRLMWSGITINKKFGMQDIYSVISIIKLLRKNGIRLVHAHGAKAGLYARVAKMILWNLQIIYSPHGGSFHSANQGSLKHFILSLEKFLAKITLAFVFESKYANIIFSKVMRIDHRKINVIENCVSLQDSPISESLRAEFQRKRDSGMKIVTVVGRVREIKGHDMVAKALAHIGENWVVYFVGNTDKGFVDANATLFNHPSIVMWGDDKDVASFYRLSDVIVCPSRAESFGYVPLEAYLCGAKIVASNIPAFRENFGNAPGVYFFEVDDYVDLAQKILDCLASKDIPESASIMERFSPENFGEKFDQLYSRLVN